ncbi:hypothetical protein J2Z49_002639 [Desulfofundulus luciae]|uniref:Glycosyltransferase RgtA/B/C/D-like domain-containing protein n=1 Tax=Desulfofundulus luciae TaxID=74702 RepID=A0ABU0B6F9_9FIRM|nr:hypothetical protein [Desulfofundulus luciae]MDQ0287511.1 hypothetical protein [Desulfofundulus luciae]
MSSRGVIAVLACALAATVFQVWTADPDVFWHLKVGEWIVRNHAVPRVDVYSWSAYGQPWTAHEWLWEVLMYLLYSVLGLPGLWLLVFVSAAACGLSIRAGLLARGADRVVASVGGAASPFLLASWLKPWPQAGVYALFSVYLYLSLHGRWGKRETLGVFFLAALWSNIHATACMLPLLLLAEFAGLKLLERRAERGLFLAFAASFLGTLVNPHGPGLWAYVVREGLLSHHYREYIAEWMPFYFGSPDLVISFFACAAIMLCAASQGRMKTLEFARAAGFWALALLSRIYMPYAVLSTAVLFGTLKLRFRERFPEVLAAFALAGAVVFLAAKSVPADLDRVAGKSYPVQAVKFVKKEGYSKVFNDYGWGGFLIFKEVPVYIDGRADLYRFENILKGYLELSKTGGISRYVAGTGADAALVIKNSLLDRALEESPRWRCAYRDEVSVVYEPVP